ncbi:hypothetical protein Plhal304r1_c045g0125391 [Plasmopara halstedii]
MNLGTTDNKCDHPTRCGFKHTHAKDLTEFVDRGVDIRVLVAVESVSELVQRSTLYDESVACKYTGPRILDATADCEATRAHVLLHRCRRWKSRCRSRRPFTLVFYTT